MTSRTAAVLLATYNGAKYLSEFLDSLVRQSCKDFDLIVRDDGSSDETLKILDSYSGRLRVSTLPFAGRLGAARGFLRLLVDAGDGFDGYLFADQDDSWHPTKVERAIAGLAREKEAPTLYCAGFELVDSNLSHIRFRSPPRVVGLHNALVENIATGCTIALNKSARRVVMEGLPERLSMHDWWLYIVLSALGRVTYDDFPALKYRQHGANAVGAAANVYQDLFRRTKRFLSRKTDGVFTISDQAAEFLRCYAEHLSAQQLDQVESLVVGKKTFLGKARLAAASGFVRQRRLDTLILRLLFLMGRF